MTKMERERKHRILSLYYLLLCCVKPFYKYCRVSTGVWLCCWPCSGSAGLGIGCPNDIIVMVQTAYIVLRDPEERCSEAPLALAAGFCAPDIQPTGAPQSLAFREDIVLLRKGLR